jgi:hypothetical protein
MSAPPPVGSLCFHCGYDLRSLTTNICPECGNRFDPKDPATYVHPAFAWQTRGLRRLLHPPPLFDCAVLVATAIFVVVRSSSPAWPNVLISSSIRKEGLGSSFWLTFLVLLALAPVATSIRRRLAHQRFAELKLRYTGPTNHRQAIMMVCSLIILATLLYPWPFWIRFAASYPALQNAVAIEQPPKQPKWVGWFYVRNIRSYPSGVVFFAIEGSYEREYGVTFARHGDAPGRPYWRNRRLWGNWFLTARQ